MWGMPLVEGCKTKTSLASVPSRGCILRGVHVKVIRRSEHPQQEMTSRPGFPRDVFFFYEKNTGVAHFHVEAGPDGRFPLDQAAGLLAMHCMVRGQSPTDYVVMVQAENEILEGLNEKADKLLEAGKSVHSQIELTRREEEVLAGLMNSLANKEIAANLNLSERTELVREASRQSAGTMVMPMPVTTREGQSYAAPAKSYSAPRRAAAVVPLAKRQLM